MKKRTETGRFTKEAAAIVIEMLKEGVVQSGMRLACGKAISHEFEYDAQDTKYPYSIGDIWYNSDLWYAASTGTHSLDIIGFVDKADRKEFKRRWRERYPKEMKPELVYPLFAKAKPNGAIILFTSETAGVCVASGSSTCNYAQFNRYWVKATNTAHWQHLTFAEAEAELFGRE
jgi:hypothetical protein